MNYRTCIVWSNFFFRLVAKWRINEVSDFACDKKQKNGKKIINFISIHAVQRFRNSHIQITNSSAVVTITLLYFFRRHSKNSLRYSTFIERFSLVSMFRQQSFLQHATYINTNAHWIDHFQLYILNKRNEKKYAKQKYLFFLARKKKVFFDRTGKKYKFAKKKKEKIWLPTHSWHFTIAANLSKNIKKVNINEIRCSQSAWMC